MPGKLSIIGTEDPDESFAIDNVEVILNGTALEGTSYSYDVGAIDPDDDTLIYSLVESPEDMNIDPDTGEISWNPTAASIDSLRDTEASLINDDQIIPSSDLQGKL